MDRYDVLFVTRQKGEIIDRVGHFTFNEPQTVTIVFPIIMSCWKLYFTYREPAIVYLRYTHLHIRRSYAHLVYASVRLVIPPVIDETYIILLYICFCIRYAHKLNAQWKTVSMQLLFIPLLSSDKTTH